MNIDTKQAQAFLAERYDPESRDVEPAGAGAWSRCFRFRCKGEKLVVRFGHHPDDFEKDRRAHAFASADLPIPEVRAIGRAFDGHYAISTRVFGVPLESLNASQWQNVIPSLVAALEAMRTADLSDTSGYGGWDGEGRTSQSTWAERLLSVSDDSASFRTHGWRAKLASSTEGDAAFEWGLKKLESVAGIPVPRNLIHGDLINRNVFVDGGRVSGLFDWGCSCYGDHLYDLAWFEFWAPWYPKLNTEGLRAALQRKWLEVGYTPQDQDARLQACYLHIGLDHLAYNAWLEDWPSLAATASRMRELVSETDDPG